MLRVVLITLVAIGFTGCELFDVIGNIGGPGTCDVFSENDCTECGSSCSDAIDNDAEIGTDAVCNDGNAGEVATADIVQADESAGVDAVVKADPLTGFEIRKPLPRQIDPGLTVEDVDYVCTLVYGEIDAYFYIQTTPFKCSATGLCQFQTIGAWISDGGLVRPVEASYNWGGHHHNDWILLRLKGLTVRYNHSSYGFGWRSCQAPDCLQIETDGMLDKDGCEPERTLPVVCRQVWADGTYDPLVDDFRTCPGDVSSDPPGGADDDDDDQGDDSPDDDDDHGDDDDDDQGDDSPDDDDDQGDDDSGDQDRDEDHERRDDGD